MIACPCRCLSAPTLPQRHNTRHPYTFYPCSSHLSPSCFSVLFVPFAAADCDAYYAKAKARFNAMGFECESLHASPDPRSTVLSAEACFVGGGNTFLLLKTLQDLDCISAMKEA